MMDGVYLRRMVCRPELVLVKDGVVVDVELSNDGVPVEISVSSSDWPAWATNFDGWPAQLASIEAELNPPADVPADPPVDPPVET